jgi:dihydroflavonol-4-reductase
MKALVIGASGHIGNAVVRALLKRKYEVTACGRRRKPPANLIGLPVRYAPGDADSADQFEKWIDGHDLVVDAAAPYPLDIFSVARDAEIDPIAGAERRTRRLLDAVSRRDAELAYVSSFVTLVRPQTRAQHLQSEMIRLAHPYFAVKQLIEAQILEAARQGLRTAIVNPTYCLGPWDIRDRRICTIPLLLSGEIPASISQALNVIDVRDVAGALLAALDAKRYGAPILLSGHDVSTHELYSAICRIGGVPPPRLSASSSLTLMSAYWIETMFTAIGRRTPLPSGGMMMATEFDYLVPGKELIELGIKLRPLADTISDAIRWYREIGYC